MSELDHLLCNWLRISRGGPITTNGGTTWAAELPPVGTTELTSISCPSVTTCFAGGGDLENDGQIIETSDGGTTWTLLTLPYAAAAAENLTRPVKYSTDELTKEILVRSLQPYG